MTRISHALAGAICLLMGWGIGTLFHECCHLAAAYSLGIPASLDRVTFSTGSVVVYGSMTNAQTAFIALAGSLGLVIAGVLMVRLSRVPVVRMIGVVFLCRAWIDALPLCSYDGGLIAGSAGYVVAMAIVVAEVMVCGGVILDTMMNTKEAI